MLLSPCRQVPVAFGAFMDAADAGLAHLAHIQLYEATKGHRRKQAASAAVERANAPVANV